jgi:hypothetical protein
MEERQRRKDDICRAQLADRRPACGGYPEHAAQRQQDALGPPGGAGRVYDERGTVDVVGIQRRGAGAGRQVVHCLAGLLRISAGKDQFGRDSGVARDPRHQVLSGGRSDDGPAACIRQSVADLAFHRVEADGNDHGAGPQAGEARFDPVHSVRQIDGDPVSLADARFRQIRGDRRSIPGELRVGNRARRIPVRNLLRSFLRMPIEELRDRRDQIYLQHRSSPVRSC